MIIGVIRSTSSRIMYAFTAKWEDNIGLPYHIFACNTIYAHELQLVLLKK